MASHSSKTTIDHDEIREWAEGRGGRPVTVRGTGDADEPGVLRIDFPGGAGEDRFEEIAWEDWFDKFDENELAFLYQEQKADGAESTFFKLIKRTGDEPAPKHKASSKQASKSKDNHGDNGHGDLDHMSKADLDARAKELGVAGRSSMNKQELIDAIKEHDGEAKQPSKAKHDDHGDNAHDLDHMSKADLDARAKELGIAGRSSMSKQELIDAIKEHDGKAKEKGK